METMNVDGTVSYEFCWTDRGRITLEEYRYESGERHYTLTFDDDGDEVRLTHIQPFQIRQLKRLLQEVNSDDEK